MCNCEKIAAWKRLKEHYEADIDRAGLEVQLGYPYAQNNADHRRVRIAEIDAVLATLSPCEGDCEYKQQQRLQARETAQELADSLKSTDLMNGVDERIQAVAAYAKTMEGYDQTLKDIKDNMDEINRIVYDPLK